VVTILYMLVAALFAMFVAIRLDRRIVYIL
jgi:hypothetical protein